jgi:hypothetical protein
MTPTLLKLNQISQGLLPWSLGVSDTASVLRDLASIATQAHPLAEELDPAMDGTEAHVYAVRAGQQGASG